MRAVRQDQIRLLLRQNLSGSEGKVTKCKAAIIAGMPLPPAGSRRRFAFYCDEWLRLRKPKIKEATYIKYETALEKHIKPRLGGCFPLGITTGIIDDFTRELLFEEELAPKTVYDILVVLNGILKHTATIFPGIFPMVEINYPKVSRREMRVLSREEQERFISYSSDGHGRLQVWPSAGAVHRCAHRRAVRPAMGQHFHERKDHLH